MVGTGNEREWEVFSEEEWVKGQYSRSKLYYTQENMVVSYTAFDIFSSLLSSLFLPQQISHLLSAALHYYCLRLNLLPSHLANKVLYKL